MTDTLRSICEQCTRLSNPQLDFIPDELRRHKEIILRDLAELVLAASAEFKKSVVTLAGSILEGVLFGFLKGQEPYISARREAEFVVDPEESLQTYVNVFNRYFSNQFPKDLLPDFVVSYRDLIHVSHEVAASPQICHEASRNMLRILDTLLGELTQAAGP
jgi:hypothetical protein